MTDEPQADSPEPEGAAAATELSPEAAEGEGPKKLTQKVELRDIGPCKKHVVVTVDRANIDALFETKYKEIVTDGTVAGFRPGKAPRRIIERRYQKDVGNQVRAEVLMQSLQQLAEENQVAALAPPNIDPEKIDIPKEGPFVYEFDVEVRPEFDLPEYKGLKLRRPVREFTDQDVALEERRILEPYGQMAPKAEPAGGGEPTVEAGDFIIADVTSRLGEQLVGEMKEVQIRVDARLAFKDGLVEDFAEKIKGAKAGDTRVVDIVLSDAVAAPQLRGKTVQATIEVKDVKTLRLPELTHELCHELGVHSAEQLRELIRVVLKRRLEYTQRQWARKQFLDQIAEATKWELPQDLLLRQAKTALGRRVLEMQSSGMSEQEIAARRRMLEQDVLQSTALALKEHFVLQKVAELEKIDVNDDDINDEIDRIADQTEESPRRVRARMEKEDLLDALAADILERKALDLILDRAEYEDVPLDQQAEPEVATVEAQTVPGEMQDPTAAPPEQPEATSEPGRNDE